jgi:hypothetical protein
MPPPTGSAKDALTVGEGEFSEEFDIIRHNPLRNELLIVSGTEDVLRE